MKVYSVIVVWLRHRFSTPLKTFQNQKMLKENVNNKPSHKHRKKLANIEDKVRDAKTINNNRAGDSKEGSRRGNYWCTQTARNTHTHDQ